MGSFGTAARLIVGWFSIVIGLLNLLADADRHVSDPDVPYLLFHGVLVLGGIVLLGLGRLAADPGRLGYLAGVAVAVIGLVAGALMAGHGFPFTYLGDVVHLVADLLFWAYAGLFVVVAVALVRRRTSRPDEEKPPIATGALAGRPLPADGSVGGLP